MHRNRILWTAVSAILLSMGCGRDAAFQPLSRNSTEHATSADTAPTVEPAPAMDYAVEAEESGAPMDWSGGGDTSMASSPAADGYGKSVVKESATEESADFDDGTSRYRERDETPAYRRQRPQSGTLTAGSFDDHRRYDAFCSFLSESLQNDPAEALPRLAIGQRVLIQVTDPQGEPIGGARVAIRAMSQHQQERPLIELPTGSDGRAVFLTAMDGRGAYAEEYLVCVTPPDGGKPVNLRTQADGQPWQIVLQDTDSRRPLRLDLALVVDTTGSMGDELEYLKTEIDDIAATVHRMFPNVDQRYALVVYRDQGDQYVTRSYDFTGSLSEFRNDLSVQRAGGGGDYPEAMHTALENAAELNWRGPNTARVMFLVGDAPPHDHFAERALDAVQSLRSRGVRIFPVAASGAAWKAEFMMRAAAFLTMGQYLFLTDHSGVGNPHATPHVPEYQVEHLNRLMIRMIAEQLAGKHLAPQEVIAIERGDQQPLQFQPVSWQCIEPPMQVSCYPRSRPRPSLRLASMLPALVALLPFRWILLGLLVGGLIVFDILRSR